MFFSLESACTKPRQELCWGAAFHPSYFYIFGVNVDVSVPSFVRNFNPKNSSKQLNQEENESQKKQHKWRRRYKTPLSIQHVPRTWTQEHGGTNPVFEVVIRSYTQMCRKWLLLPTQRGGLFHFSKQSQTGCTGCMHKQKSNLEHRQPLTGSALILSNPCSE